MGIFTNFSRLLWIASPLFAVVLSHRLRTLAMTYHTNHCSHPVIASEAKQSSKIQKNRAFTLAEIMIVLSVIGILTAILLPAARQITPDENVIKFKKGHNTLYSVIRELVTSDKYYLDGDLGVKPNGDIVNSATYFCETFADILNAKKISCSKKKLIDIMGISMQHGVMHLKKNIR